MSVSSRRDPSEVAREIRRRQGLHIKIVSLELEAAEAAIRALALTGVSDIGLERALRAPGRLLSAPVRASAA